MARTALVFLALTATTALASQGPLDRIRDLYVSADYESALAEIDRLPAPADQQHVLELDRYRAMILIALNRPIEADEAIERILMVEPGYEPGEEDAAPRIRTAFGEVRQRILPGIARTLYTEGKAAFDRQAFPEAADRLERTISMLDLLTTSGEGLSDLRTLAAGFLQLSRAAVAEHDAAVAEKEAAAPVSASVPASASATVSPPTVPTPSSADPEAAAAPAEAAGSPAPPASESVGATEPRALQQELPRWTGGQYSSQIQAVFNGLVEVDIDEHGDVVAARILDTVHPTYDPQLLAAAREWKYVPARIAGRPVKSSKRVAVVLRAR